MIYQIWNSPQGKLSYNGENTGLRYGFIRGVSSYVKRVGASKAVICWDPLGGGTIVKAEGVPEYKSNRKWSESKQKMYDQVPGVKEMMLLTCWSQAIAQGYEADDVVGAFARKYSEQGHEIVVISTDNDMAQLIGPKISVYVPGKNARMKKEEDVRTEFGVYPNALLPWRAGAGDTSDHLTGAITQGFEQDRFKAFLSGIRKEYTPQEGHDKAMAYMKNTFGEGSTTVQNYERNLGVMSLVAPPEIRIEKGRADKVGLQALFERLAFKSLMERIPEFCGELPEVKV